MKAVRSPKDLLRGANSDQTTREQPHTIIETDHFNGQESEFDDCARGEPLGGGGEQLGPVAEVGLSRLPEPSVAGQGDGVPGAG